MKQILILSVSAMKEKTYVAFMLFVYNTLGKFEVLKDKFEYYINQFKAAYDHLNLVYLKFDHKFYTEEVQKHDTERIVAFRKLRDMIRYNCTYPEDNEKAEAARVLLEIIKLYGGGDISKMKMNDRTTTLTNLIEDYEKKYQTQVEALGLGTLLGNLKQAEKGYNDVYLSRVEANSEIGLRAMADARKQMDEAYRDLVTIVNLEAKRDTEDKLTAFIKMMNTEIRKNFFYSGQSVNVAAPGIDEVGGILIPGKTATFKFKNGTTLKLYVAVGSALTAPGNTPGYMWKPEVPAIMPDRNRTFKEVPIAVEEVTATFHFYDHSEEKLKQLAGTALEAPEENDGYVWEPEVPKQMPDKDTSYYEMPESSENN